MGTVNVFDALKYSRCARLSLSRNVGGMVKTEDMLL